MTPDELSGALGDVLGVEVTDLRRLTGGASRETWAFAADGEDKILQRERAGGVRSGAMTAEAELIRAADAAGVPVASIVAAGKGDDALETGYLIADFVEGETIARKILRDDEYAGARARFAADCGRALAAIHAIDPSGLSDLRHVDQVAQYREVLDVFGDAVPTFELAFRWLEEHRPADTGEAVVHGDFRLGNLMLGPDGLRAVVDWELAHLGDPMEDLGWLCVRAWRFRGEHPVAGIGSYDDLFAAYGEAAGVDVDPDVVRWWEVLGTLKWGIMCIMQARAHLDGHSRSVELAAIGRRVCENEHDLLLLLAPEALAAASARAMPPALEEPGMHGRPTAAELVEAVQEYIDGDVRKNAGGSTAFHGRVASNVLAMVRRELDFGPAMAAEQVGRLGSLGVGSEADLVSAIQDGRFDDRTDELHRVVAETVVDKLRVANPRHFSTS